MATDQYTATRPDENLFNRPNTLRKLVNRRKAELLAKGKPTHRGADFILDLFSDVLSTRL